MDYTAVIRRLKERKLVQWALAYLAGAWMLLQLTSVLGGMYDLPRPDLIRETPPVTEGKRYLCLTWNPGRPPSSRS